MVGVMSIVALVLVVAINSMDPNESMHQPTADGQVTANNHHEYLPDNLNTTIQTNHQEPAHNQEAVELSSIKQIH